MKQKISSILAIACVAWLIASASLRAQQTSYLLIQGPFGPANAIETYKWQVNFPTSTESDGVSPLIGQDLLNAVFGQPVFTGSNYTGEFGSDPEYIATNGAISAEYENFGGSLGFALVAVTLDGVTLTQDFSTNPGWVYYVAGGSGPFNGGPYTSGTWNLANDGESSRELGSGSFDGWLFGDPGFSDGTPSTITGDAGVQPNAGTFSENSSNEFFMVTAPVPEPALPALAAAGAIAGLIVISIKRSRA